MMVLTRSSFDLLRHCHERPSWRVLFEETKSRPVKVAFWFFISCKMTVIHRPNDLRCYEIVFLTFSSRKEAKSV